jgi:hypothetical protein
VLSEFWPTHIFPEVKAVVAVTDSQGYNYLRGRPDLEEINFWQPGGGQEFTALNPSLQAA